MLLPLENSAMSFKATLKLVCWLVNLLQGSRGEDVMETVWTDVENTMKKMSFIPFSLNVHQTCLYINKTVFLPSTLNKCEL